MSLSKPPIVQLVDEMARLRGRSRELFSSVHAHVNLSEMEMGILNAVIEAVTPPTVPRIGRSLGHPRQVIQRTVNALIEAGLVETLPNPDHKRAPLLAVTPAARSLKSDADSLAASLLQPIAAEIDPERIRTAVAILHDLRAAIERSKRR